jgi:hypothetical protein
MENIVEFTYLRCPLHKYTFSRKPLRDWVESRCAGKTLNLFAGITRLAIDEVRNDVDLTMDAEYHTDACDFVRNWDGEPFETILLDPPYAYRKSMEMYNGHLASRFNQMKDAIPRILTPHGRVITFGYHSVSMGKSRHFIQREILLVYHGGAIHDTIGVIEEQL